MPSEIGRKDKLKLASDRLSLLGVQQIPSRLDTSRVQPIYEIDPQYMGPALGESSVDYDSDEEDLSGLPFLDWEVYPAQTDFWSQMQSMQIDIRVEPDTAPLTVQFIAYYQLPVGQPFRFIDYNYVMNTSASVNTNWRGALAGFGTQIVGGASPGFSSFNWPGIVYPDVPVRFLVYHDEGNSNFPAGSAAAWSRFAVRWPVGSLRPF